MGACGKPREAMGSVTFGLDTTIGTISGSDRRAQEAMGGHGRPWEAMGSVTLALDTTIGRGSASHGMQRDVMGGHGFGNFWVEHYH